jgi:hypothetical protein
MLRGEEGESRTHTHPHTHIQECSIMKPIKCFEEEGRSVEGNEMEEVNLHKVHCIHVWNYQLLQ